MDPLLDTVSPGDTRPTHRVNRRLLGLGLLVVLAVVLTGYLSGVRVHIRRPPVHRLALSAHDTVTVALEQRLQLGARWRDLSGRHMWRELKASYIPPGAGGAAEARIVLEYVAPLADSGGYNVVAIEQRGYEQPGLGLTLSHVWRFERDSTGGGWHAYR